MNVGDLIVSLKLHADASPLEHIEHKLDAVKERLEFLGAVEIARGLVELAEKFSGMGVQLETAAASAGLTTDEFQKLSYAAAQSAVNQESMGVALGHLSRILQAAKDGSQSAIDTFASAGISAQQLAGFRTSTDALYALSDAFQRTTDPIKKQALAQELLGRGSINMVNLLNKGSGAIRKVGDEAKGAGALLGHDSIEQLAKFEETMVSAGQTIKVTLAEVAAIVGPIIGEVVKHLQALIGTNQKLFKENVEKWALKFAYALGFITGGIEIVVGWVRKWTSEHPLLTKRIFEVIAAMMALSLGASVLLKIHGWMGLVVKAVGALKEAWGVMAVVGEAALQPVIAAASLLRGSLASVFRVLGELVAVAFPGLGAAIARFGTMLAATPLGPFIAGLAATVVIGKTIWDLLHGKSFRETWLGEMIAQVMDLPNKLMGVWHWIKNGKNDAAEMKPGEWPQVLHRSEEDRTVTHEGDVGQADTSAIGKLMARLGISQASAAAAAPMLAGAPVMQAPSPMALVAPDVRGATSAAPQTVTTHVDAPVTINVPPGMSPDRAAKAVTDGVQAHLDRVNRESMRSVQTASVY